VLIVCRKLSDQYFLEEYLPDISPESGHPAVIDGFFGPWIFLNNYYLSPVTMDEHTYPSVEHAYQAAKTLDFDTRGLIREVADPDVAKRLGRASRHRPDWERVKLPLMRSLVEQKFRDPALRWRLLATGDALLIEGNGHGDVFWGRCKGRGENHLGHILMAVRAEARRRPGSAAIAIHPSVVADSETRVSVERIAEARMPTRHGEFRAVGYRDKVNGHEHLALIHGDVQGKEGVLVRIHSECLTGEAFGSLRCECGPQLDMAMEMISRSPEGIVVYMRGHEGRGIGLLAKLQALQLQDSGLDTVDANLALGLPVDARDFRAGAHILKDLGVCTVRLLSNNPVKRECLQQQLVAAIQVPLLIPPHPENLAYLQAKKDRLDHDLPQVPGKDSGPAPGCLLPDHQKNQGKARNG